MVNRKKRLEKGVKSISKQIKIHEEKREKARKEGNIELAEYYAYEIEGLKKTKLKKERMLDK